MSTPYAVNLVDVGPHRVFADVYMKTLPDVVTRGLMAADAVGYLWAVSLREEIVGFAGIQDVVDSWQAWIAVPPNRAAGLYDQTVEAVRQEFLRLRIGYREMTGGTTRPLTVKMQRESGTAALLRRLYVKATEKAKGDFSVLTLVPAEASTAASSSSAAMSESTLALWDMPAPPRILSRPKLPRPEMYPEEINGVHKIPPELLAAMRPDQVATWSTIASTHRVNLEQVLEALGPMPDARRWSAYVSTPADIMSALSVVTGCGGGSLEIEVDPDLVLPAISIDAEEGSCQGSGQNRLHRVSFALSADHTIDATVRGLACFVITGGKKVDLAVKSGPANAQQKVRLLTTAPSMITAPAGWQFESAGGDRNKAPMGFLYSGDGYDGDTFAA